MSITVRGWRAGRMVHAERLPHGVDPADLLAAAGWRITAPIEAARAPGPDDPERVAVSWAVVPGSRRRARGRPPARGPGPGPGPGRGDTAALAAGGVPLVQRLGAYVLVVSELGVLAAQFSRRANRAGAWGLPGGGLEPGEQPTEAAMRECWEETGQRVAVSGLALTQSAHWVGRGPRGSVEDFHAVRLIYTATCDHPTGAVVHDRHGTTASARWVRLADVPTLAWSAPARTQLTALGVLPADAAR